MQKEKLTYLLNSEKTKYIQTPNEIFEDLKNEKFQSYGHKCFAYSYYYLISHLYRNAIYGNGSINELTLEKVTKIFLSNHRKVFYITKKGGLLDDLGYTITTLKYPISYYMNNDILTFSTIDKSKREFLSYPRLSVKMPIKSFHRFDDDDLNGTFFDFQNTHRITIDKFIDIISNDKLGHVGFYIYGYLKMMNDKFPLGYQISNKQLAELVGCTERTLAKYTLELEEKNFIETSRKIYKYKLLEKIYKIK